METVSEPIASRNQSRHERWDRMEYVEKMASYERLAAKGWSQRAIANELHVPRTTLQAWTYHRDSLDAEPEVVKFFECLSKKAWTKRLRPCWTRTRSRS